jgi:hypothetical protein
MDLFASWSAVCGRLQDLKATPTPLCEVRGGTTVRALCGVVSGALVSTATEDTLVRLQDPSGALAVCLHGAIVQEYPFAVCPGAAMILRNVTVLNGRDGPCAIACHHNVVSLFDVAGPTAVAPTAAAASPPPLPYAAAPMQQPGPSEAARAGDVPSQQQQHWGGGSAATAAPALLPYGAPVHAPGQLVGPTAFGVTSSQQLQYHEPYAPPSPAPDVAHFPTATPRDVALPSPAYLRSTQHLATMNMAAAVDPAHRGSSASSSLYFRGGAVDDDQDLDGMTL